MERDRLIEEYIWNRSREINKKYPGLLNDEVIERYIQKCKNTSLSSDDIKKSVDRFINEIELYKNVDIYALRSKNNNLGDLAVLNLNNEKNGIYLSQQQIDLLMITELEKKEEVREYVEEICSQFPNKKVEEVIPSFNDLSLEECKRYLFDAYKNTLIDYISNVTMNPILRLRHKLEQFDINEEDLNAYCIYASESVKKGVSEHQILSNIYSSIINKHPNDDLLMDKINHFMNDDFENIKDVSYDEIKSLSKFIDRDKSLDTIIIATGKYNNSVYMSQDGYKFDPYLTDKSYKYCLKHNKHMRYHSLFDYAHFETLVSKYMGSVDYRDLTDEDIEILKSHKGEVLEDLEKFVKSSFNYIVNNNKVLPDGTMAINEIEVFNELVEKFNRDINKPYSMIWEKYFGITISDIMNIFKNIEKPKGVEFIYNETTLSECFNKRRAVEKVIYDIQEIDPGFIDRFGDQMHLSDEDVLTEEGRNNLKDTAMMLSRIKNGIVLYDGELRTIKPLVTECTEHDFHFTKTFLDNHKVYANEYNLWDIKRGMQDVINEIYLSNDVTFDRITYWSLFGKNDHNVCRENRKIIRNEKNGDGLVQDMQAGLIKTGDTFDNYVSLNPNYEPKESFGY